MHTYLQLHAMLVTGNLVTSMINYIELVLGDIKNNEIRYIV